MKKIAKRLLTGLVACSLLAPVVAAVPNQTGQINVSAKVRRRHVHHIRHHVIRRHPRRMNRRRVRHRQFRHVQRFRQAPRLTNFVDQMKYQTLMDLNRDRRSHGLSSLTETRSLNRLASVRSRQLTRRFSHYDPSGRAYYRLDAKAMRINLLHYYHNRSADGENIANASLVSGNTTGTYMPNDPNEYVNHNGYDMANMDNDNMFNYDSASGWGHRRNILNSQFRKVGIGVTHSNGKYYLAEDFDS